MALYIHNTQSTQHDSLQFQTNPTVTLFPSSLTPEQVQKIQDAIRMANDSASPNLLEHTSRVVAMLIKAQVDDPLTLTAAACFTLDPEIVQKKIGYDAATVVSLVKNYLTGNDCIVAVDYPDVFTQAQMITDCSVLDRIGIPSYTLAETQKISELISRAIDNTCTKSPALQAIFISILFDRLCDIIEQTEGCWQDQIPSKHYSYAITRKYGGMVVLNGEAHYVPKEVWTKPLFLQLGRKVYMINPRHHKFHIYQANLDNFQDEIDRPDLPHKFKKMIRKAGVEELLLK